MAIVILPNVSSGAVAFFCQTIDGNFVFSVVYSPFLLPAVPHTHRQTPNNL